MKDSLKQTKIHANIFFLKSSNTVKRFPDYYCMNIFVHEQTIHCSRTFFSLTFYRLFTMFDVLRLGSKNI